MNVVFNIQWNVIRQALPAADATLMSGFVVLMGVVVIQLGNAHTAGSTKRLLYLTFMRTVVAAMGGGKQQ